MRDMMRDRGQIGKRNVALAVLVGLISFVVVLVWGVPGIDPSLWDEIAAVSGIRPPHGAIPGLWRVLTGWMFALFGIGGATGILSFLGAVVAGVCTALFYLIVRQTLALLIRTSQPYPVWYRRIAPFFAFVAAILFGIGDPIMRVAQVFSPDELRLLMFLGIVHLSLRWFTVGSYWRLFPCVALMGLFAAETPFGLVLPFVFVGAYVAVWQCVTDQLFPQPEKLPEPEALPKWRMFFLFLGTLGVGVWLNATAFIAFDGAAASGMGTADVYFRYVLGYWALLRSAASPIGWVLGLVFCVVPFVVAIRLAPALLRDDQSLPFGRGALLFFVGTLALMQSGVLATTRFWTFSPDLVRNGFQLSFFVFCAMATVAVFGAVFAFECQRTYLALADLEEAPPPPGILLKGLVPAVGCVVIVLATFTVPRPVETEMQRIVDAALSETVQECEGADWLFTDGRLDAGVEIEAKRQGKTLRALNMMGGSSAWENFVRCRGFEPGTPDCTAAETSVPVLLRIWAGEKTNGMDRAAIQLGFEFWQRERKPLPKASGMVARETGLDDETAAQGIARAKAIADRILTVAGRVGDASPSAALASAFSAVNWRIARFAHLREDAKVANGLDEANSALHKMLSAIEQERQRTFLQLTPREGLELALRRANYAEALRYAAAVLKNDTDDPQANFALGMNAINDRRYKDAEFYLSKVLKRRPREPATLNNLSIVCRKQRKYKEAEDYARRAAEILPESKEVKNTLQDAIKKAP